MTEASSRRGIQSIEIGYRLLRVLEQAPRALPLREIALGAGLSPSAANSNLVGLVRTGLEGWRQHYNTVRPHSSPRYKPPAPSAKTRPSTRVQPAARVTPDVADKPTMH